MKKGRMLVCFALFFLVLSLSMIYAEELNDDSDFKGILGTQIEKEAMEKRVAAEEKILDSLKLNDPENEIFVDHRTIDKRIDDFEKTINQSSGRLKIGMKPIFISEGKEKKIRAGKIVADADLNLSFEEINGSDKIGAILSNGRFAEIKYLPDEASAIALQKMRTKCLDGDCEVVLRETGSGEKTRLIYDIRANKEGKIFWLFKKDMQVEATINAETGNIIKIDKPWWAFLAAEKSASQEDIDESVETPNYETLDEYYNQLDFSCEKDNECVLKNVGNACGYYPKCVNAKSHTNPRFAVSAAESEGVGAVCGVEAVNGCRCVMKRCEGYFDPYLKA